MSMQARYSPARAIPGASGRIRSVNAVSIRTTSRRSAYSSSFQFVVHLDYLYRFDIKGLARGRFIVYETVDFPFVGCRHRNDGPTVARIDTAASASA